MTPFAKLRAIYMLVKTFAPLIGLVYDAVRDALPDGSKGEQKMDAFKAMYLHTVAQIEGALDVADDAWPFVQQLIEKVHLAKKVPDADAGAGA